MHDYVIVFDLERVLNRFSAFLLRVTFQTCVTPKVLNHVLQQCLISMEETWTRPVREAQNVVRFAS